VPGTARRAKQQVIADDLRAAILSGQHEDGARLPSENELARDYGVAALTARRALATLRDEGLAVSRTGAGFFARRPQPARRIGSDRYQREVDQIPARIGMRPPAETSFTRDRGIDWADYRLDKTFREVAAPEPVAELLAVEPGTLLLARHFVFYAKGQPEQLSDSYLPLSLVADTPVADPANEPWPGGNIAQLATLGIVVTRVRESVRARRPTGDEARTLRIPAGAPVFAITRVMLAGPGRDQPVEAAVDIVIPADRTVLDYAIDLDPPADPA
jgi:GntR family transcriptional regulator